MVISPRDRRQFPISQLPTDIPQTPVWEGENELDVSAIAQDFLSRFGSAVESSDWETWTALWATDGWWKDSLTLTWDKRTLRGASTIARAWEACGKRKPSGWSLDTASTGVALGPPAWIRMAPTMASLDINFSFTLDSPKSVCVGVFKLVPHHSETGPVDWKIWILTTNIVSLSEHPFRPLPLADKDRLSPSLVPASKRGQIHAQGLPHVPDGAVFDAIVVGFSSCGMANTIQLESIGLNVIAFDLQPTTGGFWAKARYEGIQLHHSKHMCQLPQHPPGSKYQEFMTGRELGEYYSETVQKLQLPMFAGIKVLSNVWNESTRLWTTEIQDVAHETGQRATIRSKNIVMSNGFLFCGVNRPKLAGEALFKGTVQHSTEVTTSEEYAGKDVLIVGSGNSAHDIGAQICRSGVAKSVSLLQRSPTVLMEFDKVFSMLYAQYESALSIDAADVVVNGMPMAVAHVLAKGLFAMLIAQAEPFNKKLEEYGYLVDREPDVLERAFEHRGKSFYIDQPGTFELVFSNDLKIKRGEAKGFTPDGVITQYQGGEEKVIEADAVILATGYQDVDLPKQYATSGFLDEKSAGMIANPASWGVDKEGENIGYMTQSGHPNLFFSAIGLIQARFIGKWAAIQVMANVTGTTPAVYPRE